MTDTTSDAPITTGVAALHAGRPDDAFSDERRALAVGPVPELADRLGHAFPDAELLDVEGTPTTLSATLGASPAILVFYRGAWCPYCNLALRTYQQELVAPLAERGVQLVAISPQRPDGSLSMQERNDLTFAVLSDPGNRLAEQLGVATAPSEEALAAQREHGLDLAAENADGTVALPMPTTAIVDADGTLRWIETHPDYSIRTEPAEILAALEAVGL